MMWKGKVVMITGGASGIGRAFALKLSRQGSYVNILDINEEAGARTALDCGENATFYKLDVRDVKAYRNLVNLIIKTSGSIDVLFNNAGIGIAGEAQEIDETLWNRIIDINIKGTLNGINLIYPIMVKRKKGVIVNTASLAGLGPLPLMAPYSMTKHAIVGLSNSLRLEAKLYGIQVNTLCPAAIETDILKAKNPNDLPPVAWLPDSVRYLSSLAGKPYDLNRFVNEALKEIEADKGVIVLPQRAKIGVLIGRWFPWLAEKSIFKAMELERSFKQE